MKKKQLIIIAVLTVAATAFFSVRSLAGADPDYFEANVEALADGEGISAYVTCSGNGQIYCPLDNKSEYREVVYVQL